MSRSLPVALLTSACCLSLLACSGCGASTSTANSHLDLAYATASSAQKLDLYLPASATAAKPAPLVIFIHGGGFAMGDKALASGSAQLSLLEHGYAVASLNYRLSGEAIFPAQIKDVKAAIRFLRANAGTYHLDPDHFATWGASAGGNLAALAGTAGSLADWDDDDLGNPGVSSAVQAVLDWYGPTKFLAMDAQATAAGCAPPTGGMPSGGDSTAGMCMTDSHDVATSAESKVIGQQITTAPTATVEAANPITYVSAATPPFFIQHGDKDCMVPTAQSQLLYDALLPVLGAEKVTFQKLAGMCHAAPGFETTENMTLVRAFLDKHLVD